jgi:UDP-N-acetylglucosamine 2-epimerase
MAGRNEPPCDRYADQFLLCPDRRILPQPVRRKIDPSRIFITGNSVVDTLKLAVEKLQKNADLRASMEESFPLSVQIPA